ncbi:MAG: radical SAM protein [Calditrichia bacterium]
MSIERTLSLSKRSLLNYINKRPFCVSFEITYRCNALCKHCHLHNVQDGPLADAQTYGEWSRMLSPVVAQVSGGEPLIRKDLVEILQAIKRDNRAPYIVLTTNGALLTEKRYKELRKAGVDEFSLSLDYPDQRHDDFRGVPGLFNKIEKLLSSLNGSNDRAITVSCVIQSDNYRELIGIADFAKKWNINANFSTYTWLRTQNKDYIIPRDELPEFRQVIEKLIDYKHTHRNIRTSDYVLRQIPMFFEKEKRQNCRASERFAIVNPDGSLSPCGLIIKNYSTYEEMREDFGSDNTCDSCYTSIRANTEKPVKYLIKDSFGSI